MKRTMFVFGAGLLLGGAIMAIVQMLSAQGKVRPQHYGIQTLAKDVQGDETTYFAGLNANGDRFSFTLTGERSLTVASLWSRNIAVHLHYSKGGSPRPAALSFFITESGHTRIFRDLNLDGTWDETYRDGKKVVPEAKEAP